MASFIKDISQTLDDRIINQSFVKGNILLYRIESFIIQVAKSKESLNLTQDMSQK